MTKYNVPPNFNAREAVAQRGGTLADKLRALIRDVPLGLGGGQTVQAMLDVVAEDVAEVEGFLAAGDVDVHEIPPDRRHELLLKLLTTTEGFEWMNHLIDETVGATRDAIAEKLWALHMPEAADAVRLVQSLTVDDLKVSKAVK